MTPPSAFTLTVETGPCQVGKVFTLLAGKSQTLGRASHNPLAISDPLLSRDHCRFEINGDALWVTDLDSANQTLVNGNPVSRQQVQPGDTITVGDTLLRVAVAAVPPPTVTLTEAPANVPVIDLGLSPPEPTSASRHAFRPILYTVAAITVVLLVATWIMTAPESASPKRGADLPAAVPADEPLHVIYEKVEATPESVFRYELTLSLEGVLAVRIDDLSQDRAVRKEKTLDPALAKDWARIVESSGFFNLDNTYLAASINSGELSTRDLTVIIGRRTHRVRVANRSDPATFAALREKLETFGQSELGIWAIQYSADKLTELAHDALLVAQKRMDERDLRYGNIALAIASFRDAEVCLETVEPKPEFYPEILKGIEEAKGEMDHRHKEYRFLADRAINLQNWEDAITQLRVICDLIPDRADDRHKEASGKLLDIERRLQAARKKR